MSFRNRSGNSLVLVLGLAAAMSVAIGIAADFSTQRVIDAHEVVWREKAASALHGVLQRQEIKAIQLVKEGDPGVLDEFDLLLDGLEPTTRHLEMNYGESEVDACVVRWKLEPCVAEIPPMLSRDQDGNGIPDAVEDGATEFLTNPAGEDGVALKVPTKRIENEFTYFFRLSGESRCLPDGDVDRDGELWDEEPIAKAQAARYIAVIREPVFRYVIYYAQPGPKGDLELSHADTVRINGRVQSNGAIYLGSGTSANEVGALNQGSQMQTLIGPRMRDLDGDGVLESAGDVRVTGVDGIFRLSKPLLYGLFSDWAGPASIAGFTGGAPAAGNTTLGYDLTNSPHIPLSGRDGPLGDLATATNRSDPRTTWINPYRVLGEDRIATTGTCNIRINGVEVTKDNDSRDRAGRPGNYTWSPTSLTNWRGAVRSAETGGRTDLDRTGVLLNRPLEAQAVYYDPRNNTEDHHLAIPTFLDQTAGRPTMRVPPQYALTAGDIPAANDPDLLDLAEGTVLRGGEIEYPGRLVSKALGSPGTIESEPELFFERIYSTRHIGGNSTRHPSEWRVVDRTGTAVVQADDAQVGLTIRERIVPYWNSARWNGEPVPGAMLIDAPGSVPYAYGKHSSPSIWPFTSIWVTDRGIDGNTSRHVSTSFVETRDSGNNFNAGTAFEQYSLGGLVRLRAGSDAGCPEEGDRNPNPDGRPNSPEDGNGWYRGNWRFVNLRRDGTTRRDNANFSTASPIYFQGDQIRRVVGRLVNLTGGHDSNNGGEQSRFRKAGLMIRPVAVDSSLGDHLIAGNSSAARGLNSRDPYAAILYSPERGIFTQRRTVPSSPDGIAAVYTGRGLSPIASDPGDLSPGTEKLNLFRIDDRVTPTDVRDVDDHTGSDVTIDFESSNSTETLYGSFKLRRGPFGKTPWHKFYRTRTLHMEFVFPDEGYSGEFKPTDVGQPFTLFGVPPDANWTRDITEINKQPATNPRNNWVRVNVETKDTGNTGKQYGARVDQPGITANTIFIGWEQWNAAVTFFTRHHGAGAQAKLISELAAKGYNVATPNLPDPPPFTAPDPGQPPSIAILPTNSSGNTFQVERSRRQDRNSYLSTRGWTHDEPRLQWLPPPGTIAAPTISTWTFRPDQWTKLSGAPGVDAERAPDATSRSWQPNGGILPRDWADAQRFEPGDIVQRSGLWYECITGHNSTTTNYPTGQAITPVPGALWAWRSARGWEDRQFPNWPERAAGGYALGDIVNCDSGLYRAIVPHMPSSTSHPVTGADRVRYWERCDAFWMMIEQEFGAGGIRELVFKYAIGVGDVPPALSDYRETRVDWRSSSDSLPTRIRVAGNANPTRNWPSAWLIGLALQSGKQDRLAEADFSDIAIELIDGDVIDRRTWEEDDVFAPLAPNLMTRYLASQYQVFWGAADITEDFFLWGQSKQATRIAKEEWIIQPREFWSQSRWWNEDGRLGQTRSQWVQKDSGDNYTSTIQRRRWARTTYLDVNVANLSAYLRSRTVGEARNTRFYQDVATAPPPSGPMLAEVMNGLVYVARTNRFPWNPTRLHYDTDFDGTDDLTQTENPWNTSLPNDRDSGDPAGALDYRNLSASAYRAIADDWAFNSASTAVEPALQPYHNGILPLAPPIPQQEFHHGVMWSNAANVDWGYDGNPASADPFGTSKTTLASPNAVYLRGDLNTIAHSTEYRGDVADRFTPLGVFGDSITMLSNAWSPTPFRFESLTTDAAGTRNGSSIMVEPAHHPASTTTYRAAILTHNQPSTAERVMFGQSAAFIDTMMFLEDWTGKAMNFFGSLVVADSRRYTRGFLLGARSRAGRSPFGVIGWHSGRPYNDGPQAPDWLNNPAYYVPSVYAPPSRNFNFNEDLLTRPGTPPFTPVGVTTAGAGSWTKIYE